MREYRNENLISLSESNLALKIINFRGNKTQLYFNLSRGCAPALPLIEPVGFSPLHQPILNQYVVFLCGISA